MKRILRTAVGGALGAMLALIGWHGFVRWLPWWAQVLVGALIGVGLLGWACCAVIARADLIEQGWRDDAPRALGEDVSARVCGVIRRGQCDYYGHR